MFDTLYQIMDRDFWDIDVSDSGTIDFLHNDCTKSIHVTREQVIKLVNQLIDKCDISLSDLNEVGAKGTPGEAVVPASPIELK